MATRDIYLALRKKDLHTANEQFSRTMQEKLAERLAFEKCEVSQDVLNEDIFASIGAGLRVLSHEIQKIWDTAMIALGANKKSEVELMCNVKDLKVNDNGQVVSFVNEQFDSNYFNNPYHDILRKAGFQYSHTTGNGHTYLKDRDSVTVDGINWSALVGGGPELIGGHPNTRRAGADLERYLSDRGTNKVGV